LPPPTTKVAVPNTVPIPVADPSVLACSIVLLGIMPLNKALMATPFENANPSSRALIIKWNRLHTVRTILGERGRSFFHHKRRQRLVPAVLEDQ